MTEPELWAAWLASGRRDLRVRNELMVRYLPLVESIAKRLSARLPRHALCDASDLAAFGVLGLVHAIERFDPERGTAFASYARRRVHGEAVEGLRGLDHVPRCAREREESGRSQPLPRISSIDRAGVDGRRARFADLFEDPRSCQGTRRVDANDALDARLRGLPRKDRAALTLYFRDGLTMREIGRALGLSESRISQVINAALDVLAARKETT